jgi:hypothetical protein
MEAAGKWVFVPLDNWESKSPEYYSMERCRITAYLFHKTDIDRMHFCVEHLIMPPRGKFRAGKNLDAWIDQQRRLIERGKIVRMPNLATEKIQPENREAI